MAVERALEMATLGNPMRMLDTRQRKVRESNTYTVLAQLADITGSASRLYRESRDATMERQANTDIINNTINPDLEHHEGMYALTVAKGQSTQDFMTLKKEVESGMHDRTTPEEYQERLREMHSKRTKSYAGTSFESITNDAHNKFWVNNEPTLVAGQSGRYRLALKNDMISELGKVVGAEAVNPNAVPEDIITSLNDPDYTMLTYDDRANLGLAIASMAANQGNTTLISALDAEYKYSIDPEKSVLFNTAMKTARQRQKAAGEMEALNLRIEYDRLRTDGELTEDDWIVWENRTGPDGKPIVTYKEFSKALVTANTNRLKKIEVADAREAFGNMQNISMVKTSTQQEVFDAGISEIIGGNGTPGDQGKAIGIKMSVQTTPSDMLRNMGDQFAGMDPINKDGSVNKLVGETYQTYKGMQQGFQSDTKLQDNIGKEAYARMKTMDHIFDTTFGTVEDKTLAAMKKLSVVMERRKNGAITSTTRIPEDVDKGITKAAVERLTADDKWFAWDTNKQTNTTAGDFTRHAEANYLWNLNNLGVSEEIAMEMAINETNAQFKLFDGSLSIVDAADWNFGASDDDIAASVRSDTAIQSLVAQHQGKPEPDMEKVQLKLNSETDSISIVDDQMNIIYSLPTAHAKVMYQNLHQDVGKNLDYSINYSPEVLATEEGKEWADHASLRNDMFTTQVVNAEEDPSLAPGIKRPDPAEWHAMSEQEKTETQVEYYRQNLLSAQGLGMAVGQLSRGAVPTGIKVLASAGLERFKSLTKGIKDHYDWIQEHTDGIPRAPQIIVPGAVTPEQLGIEAREFTEFATYEGDGKVKATGADFRIPTDKVSLPEFISQVEGTSDAQAKKNGYASGYDVTLGYGAYDPDDFDSKKEKITELTMDKVFELGGKILKHKDNDMDSTAMGKWQLTRTNMKDLMKRNKVDVKITDTFNKTTQDKFYKASLEKRGLSKYKAGKITKDKFIANLKLEWEGLDKTDKEWSNLVDSL